MVARVVMAGATRTAAIAGCEGTKYASLIELVRTWIPIPHMRKLDSEKIDGQPQ
jgi:hypothetical protein